MDKIRRHHTDNIRAKIDQLEKANIRDDTKIRSLSSFISDPVIVKNKKQELITLIKKRTSQISELTDRNKDIHSGQLDTELLGETRKTTAVIDNKTQVIKDKRKTLYDDKTNKLKKLYLNKRQYQPKTENPPVNSFKQIHNKLLYPQRRSLLRQNIEKPLSPEYLEFRNVIISLPDKMRRNLLEMPNNKGYIHQGCWFMGKKPEEKNQPTIMFEKKSQEILHIHEYGENDYKLFEKIDNNKKELIMVKRRMRFQNAPSKWL